MGKRFISAQALPEFFVLPTNCFGGGGRGVSYFLSWLGMGSERVRKRSVIEFGICCPNLFLMFQEHMIENEILILRRIRHKNIVELMEEFETPKEIFLVMELVEVCAPFPGYPVDLNVDC